MKPMKLIFYPNNKLRKGTVSFLKETESSEVEQLFKNMLFTLNFFEGFGLAASQVGISMRAIVVNDRQGTELAMLNPEITSFQGEQDVEETCLSFPYQKGTVKRYLTINVKYRDQDFEEKHVELSGFLSAIVQHEIDHLDNILFTDRMSKMTRELITKRIRKRHG
jgi:peptide deformylase